MHLEHRTSLIQSALETITAELRTSEQANEEFTAQQREAERNLFATEHRHEQMQSDLARLGLGADRLPERIGARAQGNRCRPAACATRQEQHEFAALSRAEAEAENARLTGEVAQLRDAMQSEQDELATAKAELAAMNERLASAEAIAKRLQEERDGSGRREAALRQQEASINEETAAMARQTEELTLQLEVLRGEKARLEENQKELEQEWDAAARASPRPKIICAWRARRSRRCAKSAASLKSRKHATIPIASTCAKLAWRK